MSGPYVAAFLIKDSYGELTPHPALRGHLQSTRQEPSTAVALRHAPAGAAPRGKPLEFSPALHPQCGIFFVFFEFFRGKLLDIGGTVGYNNIAFSRAQLTNVAV